jgi:hypothetical protein
MERRTKSEWFRLDNPIGEPEIRWNNDPYDIERVVTSDGTTIWFGQATNWKKEQNGEWTKLTTNEDAKPLEPQEKSFSNTKTPLKMVTIVNPHFSRLRNSWRFTNVDSKVFVHRHFSR